MGNIPPMSLLRHGEYTPSSIGKGCATTASTHHLPITVRYRSHQRFEYTRPKRTAYAESHIYGWTDKPIYLRFVRVTPLLPVGNIVGGNKSQEPPAGVVPRRG